MPEIFIKQVISYSEQDTAFPASNLLKPSQKWLAPANCSLAHVVLQLGHTCKISHIDIGSEWVFCIEIAVGRSVNSLNEFQSLLAGKTLLTPQECRKSKTGTSVNMFSTVDFCEETKNGSWDLIKVSISQPFKRDVKIGLSLIRVVSSDITISPKLSSLPSSPIPSFLESSFQSPHSYEKVLKRRIAKSNNSPTSRSSMLMRAANIDFKPRSTVLSPQASNEDLSVGDFRNKLSDMLAKEDLPDVGQHTISIRGLRKKMEGILRRQLTPEERDVLIVEAEELLSSVPPSESQEMPPRNANPPLSKKTMMTNNNSSFDNLYKQTKGIGTAERCESATSKTSKPTSGDTPGNSVSPSRARNSLASSTAAITKPTPSACTSTRLADYDCNNSSKPTPILQRIDKFLNGQQWTLDDLNTVSVKDVRVKFERETKCRLDRCERAVFKAKVTTLVNKIHSKLTQSSKSMKRKSEDYLSVSAHKKPSLNCVEEIDLTMRDIEQELDEQSGKLRTEDLDSDFELEIPDFENFTKNREKLASHKESRKSDVSDFLCRSPKVSSVAGFSNMSTCPMCGGHYPSSTIEAHANCCLNEAEEESMTNSKSSPSPTLYTNTQPRVQMNAEISKRNQSDETTNCPICNGSFPIDAIEIHASLCAERLV